MNTWGYTIHAPFHAVYDSPHRSVYLMVQRNRRHPFLALFDAADPNLSTAERLPTVTPTQALYLMNSPFVREQSEALARRLLAAAGDEAARIAAAYELCPRRRRRTARRCATRRSSWRPTARSSPSAGPTRPPATLGAWSALCRVLLTGNAFLYRAIMKPDDARLPSGREDRFEAPQMSVP